MKEMWKRYKRQIQIGGGICLKEYNQFYHDFSILREENEAVKVFRIALSANVAKVVRLGMGLLGIEVHSRIRCPRCHS